MRMRVATLAGVMQSPGGVEAAPPRAPAPAAASALDSARPRPPAVPLALAHWGRSPRATRRRARQLHGLHPRPTKSQCH
eukprot:177743-Alexandrium_andersonii.AAC.1